MQNAPKLRPKSPARNPYLDTPTSVFISNGEYSSKSQQRDGRFHSRKNVSLHPIAGVRSGLSPQPSSSSVVDPSIESGSMTPKTDYALTPIGTDRLRAQLAHLLRMQNSQRDVIASLLEELTGPSPSSEKVQADEPLLAPDASAKRLSNEGRAKAGSRHVSPAVQVQRDEPKSKRAASTPSKGQQSMRDSQSDIQSDSFLSHCYVELSKALLPCVHDLENTTNVLLQKLKQLLDAEALSVYFLSNSGKELVANPWSSKANSLDESKSRSSLSWKVLCEEKAAYFVRGKADGVAFPSAFSSEVDGCGKSPSQIQNLLAVPFHHQSNGDASMRNCDFRAVLVCCNLANLRLATPSSDVVANILAYVAPFLSTYFAFGDPKKSRSNISENSDTGASKASTDSHSTGLSMSGISKEFGFVKDLDSANDIMEIFSCITKQIKDVMHTERCMILRLDQSREKLATNEAMGALQQAAVSKAFGVEGIVMQSGEPLIILDAPSDSRFEADSQLHGDSKIVNLVCCPIVFDQQVIGVVEVINKRNGFFTNRDVRTLQMFSFLVAYVIRNQAQVSKLHRLEHTIQAFLGASNTFRSGNDVASMVRAIMSQAQDVVNADRFTVFEVDRLSNEIRSKICIGMDEIVIPMGKGIVGHVVAKEEPITVPDVSIDPLFYDAIDRKCGYKTRDVMCVPIFNKVSDLVGVVEMVNKKSEAAFDKDDLEVLKAFTSFLSMSLTSLSDLNNPFTMDDVRTKGSLDYYEKRYCIPDRGIETIAKLDFKCWEFSVDEIVGLFVYMFEDLGFIQKYKIDRLKLYNFLLKCQSLYRSDVPYHNFVHAFDVTHCTYLFFKHCNIREYLTDVEIFGLFVASVCHDLDHRGFNNAFQVKMKSPIALLYNNVAVMENHHCATAVTIMSIPENNILENLSEEDYGVIWQVIIASILATDMASHFEYVGKIEQLVKDQNYSKENPEHRKLLHNILIKCSDISNIAKPFPVAKHWADVVTVEFFNQGDAEKQYNLPVTPIMDREKVVLPQMQMGFIGAIGVPIFTHLAGLVPDLGIFRDCVVDNKEQWNLIFQQMQQQATS
eukprot:TRINITY_DN4310_c0_g1_i4.p1 TRINITY_DN4310_c0_g1~~TRINITY_DN4310_c0_g1_i4.p1  ORF type:complete len:1071 (+),score=217.40 TRINITY_DN4310_c0_g1_i4:111-3323(+)